MLSLSIFVLPFLARVVYSALVPKDPTTLTVSRGEVLQIPINSLFAEKKPSSCYSNNSAFTYFDRTDPIDTRTTGADGAVVASSFGRDTVYAITANSRFLRYILSPGHTGFKDVMDISLPADFSDMNCTDMAANEDVSVLYVACRSKQGVQPMKVFLAEMDTEGRVRNVFSEELDGVHNITYRAKILYAAVNTTDFETRKFVYLYDLGNSGNIKHNTTSRWALVFELKDGSLVNKGFLDFTGSNSKIFQSLDTFNNQLVVVGRRNGLSTPSAISMELCFMNTTGTYSLRCTSMMQSPPDSTYGLSYIKFNHENKQLIQASYDPRPPANSIVMITQVCDLSDNGRDIFDILTCVKKQITLGYPSSNYTFLDLQGNKATTVVKSEVWKGFQVMNLDPLTYGTFAYLCEQCAIVPVGQSLVIISPGKTKLVRQTVPYYLVDTKSIKENSITFQAVCEHEAANMTSNVTLKLVDSYEGNIATEGSLPTIGGTFFTRRSQHSEISLWGLQGNLISIKPVNVPNGVTVKITQTADLRIVINTTNSENVMSLKLARKYIFFLKKDSTVGVAKCSKPNASTLNCLEIATTPAFKVAPDLLQCFSPEETRIICLLRDNDKKYVVAYSIAMDGQLQNTTLYEDADQFAMYRYSDGQFSLAAYQKSSKSVLTFDFYYGKNSISQSRGFKIIDKGVGVDERICPVSLSSTEVTTSRIRVLSHCQGGEFSTVYELDIAFHFNSRSYVVSKYVGVPVRGEGQNICSYGRESIVAVKNSNSILYLHSICRC